MFKEGRFIRINIKGILPPPPLGDEERAGVCRGELARALAARMRREAPAERRRAVRRLVLLAAKSQIADGSPRAREHLSVYAMRHISSVLQPWT